MGQPEKTRLIGFIDSETNNNALAANERTLVAVPIAYSIKERDGGVSIVRTPSEAVARVIDMARPLWKSNYTAVFGVYNARFDICPLESYFKKRGLSMRSFARGANTYAIDLYSTRKPDASPRIRFWDIRNMLPEGLAKMGEIIGRPKLRGAWDYNKKRSPRTPISSAEYDYMCEDVAILDEFCAFLLKEFPWIKEDDFGLRVLTAASIARLYQQRIIAPIHTGAKTAGAEFHAKAAKVANRASDFWKSNRINAYAGGYAFVRRGSIYKTYEDVLHVDIDSAYHHALATLAPPTRFIEITDYNARLALSIKIQALLDGFIQKIRSGDYTALNKPINGLQFHARVRLKGVRKSSYFDNGYISARRVNAELLKEISDARRVAGKINTTNAIMQDNRITEAETLEIFVDENELAALAIAYTWDEFKLLNIEIGAMPQEASIFARLATLALRAEKTARKTRGGGQYELFKRIYNSQAGIYAETRDEGRFSYANLPLAIRTTSSTRLFVVATQYALTRAGLKVISGDTDSLKIVGNEQAALATIAKLNDARAIVKATEFEREIIGSVLDSLADSDAAQIGKWQIETRAKVHKEIGAKQRLFIREDGKVIIKYAGARTSKLARKLNEKYARDHNARAIMDIIKPHMWIAHELIQHVKVYAPEETKPKLVIINGKEYVLPLAPRILDSMICTPLANVAKYDHVEFMLSKDLTVEKWCDHDE